jgi:CheY-like chemotaxis protein
MNETMRIVVVDDEIFTLKLMAHILGRLGYTNVVACDSGAKALEEVSREGQPADLVFLDINMPGMDGVHPAAGRPALPGRHRAGQRRE